MSNTESVHGHDVMKMMIEAETPFTREGLVAAMAERFGAEARYHTCSAQDMDAAAVIEFLAQRGKFVDAGEGFSTAPDRICNH